MSKNLIDREALLRINIEDLPQKVLKWLAKMGRHAKLSLFDLAVEHTDVLILEGQEAAVHCEENDTRRPDIDLAGVVILLADHLWRCVTGRSTGSLKKLTVLEEVTKPKIGELDFLAVQQNVLRFEVAMSYAQRVKVLDSL